MHERGQYRNIRPQCMLYTVQGTKFPISRRINQGEINS